MSKSTRRRSDGAEDPSRPGRRSPHSGYFRVLDRFVQQVIARWGWKRWQVYLALGVTVVVLVVCAVLLPDTPTHVPVHSYE